MSAPNTPKAKAIHPPTETPLPDREASTQQVCEWIKTWHKDHEVEVDEVTLTQVTWTGRWIHEQPPAQLETDIASWGVPQRRARMMVLDLVRERRHPTKFKPASLTASMKADYERLTLRAEMERSDVVVLSYVSAGEGIRQI
jgi:hypothetical protein